MKLADNSCQEILRFMELAFDHNKLLKRIAKERLAPHRIFQEGKSRSFLFDNGWWTIMIEFQSSDFSKGTYLNIGVDFNFYPKDYFAFTYGHREKGLEQALDEKQFEQVVIEFCEHAIIKVEELKVKFRDIHSAIKTYRRVSSDEGWDNFNLGVLYGIAGDFSLSKKYLKRVVREKAEYDFELERQQLAVEIISWLIDHDSFIGNLTALINKTRQMKKLPLFDLSWLGEEKNKPSGLIERLRRFRIT